MLWFVPKAQFCVRRDPFGEFHESMLYVFPEDNQEIGTIAGKAYGQ